MINFTQPSESTSKIHRATESFTFNYVLEKSKLNSVKISSHFIYNVEEILKFNNIEIIEFLNKIESIFEIPKENYCYSNLSSYQVEYLSTTHYFWKEGLVLIYEERDEDLIIYFDDNHEEHYDKLIDYFKEFKRPEIKKERKKQIPYFHLLIDGGAGVRMMRVQAKKPKIDLSLHYDELKDKSSTLIKDLRNGKNGIALLYGPPGTGKTTYIRHLMTKVADYRDIIYIPASMSDFILSPSFLPLMIENTGAIIIIEDAESLLATKNGDMKDRSSALAGVLNSSDGLLSDVLGFTFICSFNTEVENVDPAVRRPGRLIFEHEFNPLTYDKSLEVAKSLDVTLPEEQKPYTLAEIFNIVKK